MTLDHEVVEWNSRLTSRIKICGYGQAEKYGVFSVDLTFLPLSVNLCEALGFCSIPNCFPSKGHGGVDT